MYKKSKLKIFVVTLLAALLSVSMFATTVEAKAAVIMARNAVPVITNGDTTSITMNQGEISAAIVLNAMDSNTTDRLTWSVSVNGTYGNAIVKATNTSGRQANYICGRTGSNRLQLSLDIYNK